MSRIMSSALTARVLPPEDWAVALKGTALEGQPLNPDYSTVVVVEVDGEVVACWAAINTVHVEGLWVRQDHRKHGGTARALLAQMVIELLHHGVQEVLTTAVTGEVEALIQRAGGRQVPGTQWVLPLGEIDVDGLKEG